MMMIISLWTIPYRITSSFYQLLIFLRFKQTKNIHGLGQCNLTKCFKTHRKFFFVHSKQFYLNSYSTRQKPTLESLNNKKTVNIHLIFLVLFTYLNFCLLPKEINKTDIIQQQKKNKKLSFLTRHHKTNNGLYYHIFAPF